MKSVVIALDGTLSDPKDGISKDVLEFIDAVAGKFRIVIITVSEESDRIVALRWFHKFGLDGVCSDLLMRKTGDHSPDHEIKIKLIDEHFSTRENALKQVLLVLDNEDGCVEAWRRAGFRCW